jgi:outer membrane protein assembly factor BamB
MQSSFSGLISLLAVCVAAIALRGGEPIGWRTDGTGSYPRARPPLEWSSEKNVVWKTPMPGASNSIPVLLGQRIFICAEPCTLLCLHRDDGRILWKKTSSYDDLEIEPALRERIKVEMDEAKQLAKQQSEVKRESETLRRQLKENPAAKPDIEKKLEVLRREAEALLARQQKLTLALRYTERPRQPTAGYSSPTPVTNGQEVLVAFGNGLVACFDLDGNRKWLKLVEQSTAPFAHSNSPVLVGDKVVIHFADLVALHTKDGSECWRVKRPPAHGTPAVARIGDVEVLVTPFGLIVRADDGAVLAEELGKCGANSPLLHEGKVYFVRSAANAIQLPPSVTQPLQVETLWKAKVGGTGYWFSSPVIHDGLLYAASDQGIYSVLEIATGKMVCEGRLNLEGRVYPSISLAGNRVHVSSDAGETVVLQAGREYRELARNRLEPFRSSLVFEGKRLYVRTLKNLYCIGE